MARTAKKRGKRGGAKTRGAGGSAKSGSAGPRQAGEKAGGRRGTAPWAARHAAKHAAEARARNAGPPRPGSARATLRTPEGAEQLKQRIAELHEALGRIRALEKKLPGSFYELGVQLANIQSAGLYEAKGYSSLAAFAERELELGKDTATRLARIPALFREAAAKRHGMDALFAALAALDEHDAAPAQPGRPARPLKPPSGR